MRERISIIVLTLFTIGWGANEAHAGKRVVLFTLNGPRGGEATRTLSHALANRYEMVSQSKFIQEGKQRRVNINDALGRSTVARALKVTGIISGSIVNLRGKWVMRISVFSAHSGRPVAVLSFPLRGTRLDPLTMQKVSMGIHQAMGRARGGPSLTAIATSETRTKRDNKVAGLPSTKRVSSKPTRPSTPPPIQPGPSESGEADADEMADESGSRAEVSVAPQTRTSPSRFDSREDNNQANSSYRASRNDPITQPHRPDSYEDVPRMDSQSTYGSRDSLSPRRESGGDLGFDVGGNQASSHRRLSSGYGDENRERPDAKIQLNPKQKGNPSWEKGLEFSLGMFLLNRSLTFNDPQDQSESPSYEIRLTAAFFAQGALYPLVYLGPNPLTNLGITTKFYYAVGLRSQIQNKTTPVPSTLYDLEFGLRYRWNILHNPASPVWRLGFNYGVQVFKADWEPSSSIALPPNINYEYLNFSVADFIIPFYFQNNYSFGATGLFNFLYILSAGEIERTDSEGYGPSSTMGIDVGVGLYFDYNSFTIKASGLYRRIFYAFLGDCTDCRKAGGALDIYLGLLFTIGYSF